MNKKIYSEDDLLPLSGLQHYFYCKRQWALIHVENQWIENALTAEGRIMHDRVDNNKYIEYRDGIIVQRSFALQSRELGVCGVADVVEFIRSETGIKLSGECGFWRPMLVEYKRGRPKAGICDKAQLCGQAMCLEEMYGIKIESGNLYYGKTRRRLLVIFDDKLRNDVRYACSDMHNMIEKGITPGVPKGVKCRNCSLINICVPTVQKKKSSDIEKYINDRVKEF